ncbi:MAG: hypothetical protein KDB94_13155, partial [Acidobacteria bacterium]|nr:hypothetical protein [Acidobacteriota bacterium]
MHPKGLHLMFPLGTGTISYFVPVPIRRDSRASAVAAMHGAFCDGDPPFAEGAPFGTVQLAIRFRSDGARVVVGRGLVGFPEEAAPMQSYRVRGGPIALAAFAVFTCSSAKGAEPELAPPPARVEALAWLAGCWAPDGGESGSVEQWTAPAGGTMLGLSRTIRNGTTR